MDMVIVFSMRRLGYDDKCVDHVSEHMVDNVPNNCPGTGLTKRRDKILVWPDGGFNTTFHSSPSRMHQVTGVRNIEFSKDFSSGCKPLHEF